MEYRYGNLKNLAELKSAVNQSGITDSIPPENPNSLFFGTQAALVREKFFPSLNPMNSPDKKEKKEENLTGEIIETGIQHGAIHALGDGLFNTSIIAFAMEFMLKANEAYHELKLDKELAMEAGNNINLGRPVEPSFTDLKSRIRVLKSELEESDENNKVKNKKRSSNSIRYGRNAKYSPY